MLSDLEKPQKIFFYIMFAVTAIALALGIFAGYNLALVAKPRTLGVSYATVLTTSSGEVPICEIEMWDNANNNGLKAYGVRWNSYTDVEGSWVKGFGLQVTGDIWGVSQIHTLNSVNKLLVDSYINSFGGFATSDTAVYGNWSLYQSDDLGESSYELPRNELNNNLYIDIEGNYYQILLNDYAWVTKESTGFLGLKTKEVSHSAQYTWFEFAQYIYQSLHSHSNNIQDGTYYINLLECDTYYRLLYQTDKGQYKELDKVSDLRNYLQIKINYHKDGITDASQSMFKQVNNNPSWNYWEGTEVEDFWSVVTPLYLDESNISTIADESTGNYYITITKEFADYIDGLSNAEVYVNINLDNLEVGVSGILMDNFTFKTQEFNITATNSQVFDVLNPNTINTPILNIGGDAS